MGPFSQVLDMMGMGKVGAKLPVDAQQEKMKKWKFMLHSMTAEEKNKPDTITSSRIRRIAQGSGTPEHDVREFLANYNKVKKMMKKLSPGKLKRSGLFKQFGMGKF